MRVLVLKVCSNVQVLMIELGVIETRCFELFTEKRRAGRYRRAAMPHGNPLGRYRRPVIQKPLDGRTFK
jgi:hypothetical protein